MFKKRGSSTNVAHMPTHLGTNRGNLVVVSSDATPIAIKTGVPVGVSGTGKITHFVRRLGTDGPVSSGGSFSKPGRATAGFARPMGPVGASSAAGTAAATVEIE
ncbi:MAG: hypothetical protein JST89_18150 [Cyanobacteria bacterium SZAS-4]|nr:hypothetical protein [Cyanobacteria bacterium SZAS-4]